MSQNRNKIIDIFVGNTVNAIVHVILQQSISDEDVSKKYLEEVRTSLKSAKKYREKVNPINTVFQRIEAENLKIIIQRKVEKKLHKRIAKGYKDIAIGTVEENVVKILQELKVL
ncbi:hypothetical protein HY483_00340 [Candidatus Woesearchaeota archaeon]|nr:hypothetical protein [Candidatus Woesearchaeota archaeon]